MHGTASELASSSTSTPSFPLTFEQSPEGSSRFVLLALLCPVVAALMAPFWLIFSKLVSDPATRAIVEDRPLMAFELMLGLLVLAWIFGLPLANLVRTVIRRRQITIDGVGVRVRDRGLFRTRTWAEPMGAYAGVTHRVRSSLSGVRHELVLVHRRPSRSVVLQSSSQISQDVVDRAARLFSIAEIPSREAASFAPLHGYFHLAEPQPQMAAAPL
jgi:hypothetical protein